VIAAADKAEPDGHGLIGRRRRSVVTRVGGALVENVAPLEDGLLVVGAGGIHHEVVGRFRGQVGPDHEASLGPEILGGGAGDAGHDLAVAGQRLVDVVEVVLGVPDIAARGRQRVGAGGRIEGGGAGGRGIALGANILVGGKSADGAGGGDKGGTAVGAEV